MWRFGKGEAEEVTLRTVRSSSDGGIIALGGVSCVDSVDCAGSALASGVVVLTDDWSVLALLWLASWDIREVLSRRNEGFDNSP